MCTCISYMPLRTRAAASSRPHVISSAQPNASPPRPVMLPFKPLSNEQMKSGCLSLCIQAAPLCGRFVCLSRTLSPHLHLGSLHIFFIITHFKSACFPSLVIFVFLSLSLSLFRPIEFSCNDTTHCRKKLIAFEF